MDGILFRPMPRRSIDLSSFKLALGGSVLGSKAQIKIGGDFLQKIPNLFERYGEMGINYGQKWPIR